MKKLLIFVAVVGVAAVALGFAGFTYAQSQGYEIRDFVSGVNRFGGPGQDGDRLPVGDGDFNCGRNGHGLPGFEPEAALEEILGLTPAEVMEKIQNGEAFEDIVTAQGLTMEEFNTEMASAYQAAIEAAVEDETLTPEQGEALLEKLQERLDAGFGFGGFGPHGDGGFHEHHGPGKRGPHAPPEESPEDAPASVDA